MKRICLSLIVLCINSIILLGQGVYFKTSSNFNISSSTQQMPEFFSYVFREQSYSEYGVTNTIHNINISSNEFSISAGLNYQGAIGYTYNENLSFEVKFSMFRNSKKEFDASPELENAENGKTEWDFHNYSLLPTVLFGQNFNKSTINIFIYSGFGFGKLNIKASFNENFREYKFDRNQIFSWGYGLDYNYNISKNISWFTNIGISNTFYIPEKAELIVSSTSQLEIQYVDEIKYLELGNSFVSPEIRLKETLKLNSVFWGIGIKYTLK